MKPLLAALLLAAGWLCPCAEAQQKAPLAPPPFDEAKNTEQPPAGSKVEYVKLPAQASNPSPDEGDDVTELFRKPLLTKPSEQPAWEPPEVKAARADAERRKSQAPPSVNVLAEFEPPSTAASAAKWRWMVLVAVAIVLLGLLGFGARVFWRSRSVQFVSMKFRVFLWASQVLLAGLLGALAGIFFAFDAVSKSLAAPEWAAAWRWGGLALVPLAFIGLSAWGASILVKSGRIGRLLLALRAVPERLLTPRRVLLVACLLLIASWAYPPGFERESRHVSRGWFFLFDPTSDMQVDFPRLILLDAIIAAGAGMVAWGVSRSSSSRGTVVRLAFYLMVGVPVLAVAGGTALVCVWAFPQAEAWANQPAAPAVRPQFDPATAQPDPPFDPKTATFDPDAFLAETRVLKLTKDTDVQLAYGKMKLPVGTPVKFVSREGNVVKVSYLNTILTLPVNSTDLGVPVAAPRDPPPSVRPTP